MNVNYNGLVYWFDKNTTMRNDIYYDRCWYIAKRMPKTEEEFILANQFADIYINNKYLGCCYNQEF